MQVDVEDGEVETDDDEYKVRIRKRGHLVEEHILWSLLYPQSI